MTPLPRTESGAAPDRTGEGSLSSVTCDRPGACDCRLVTRDLAPNSSPGNVTSSLVLSVFPGIDLLGMGFEHQGFCIVRGPDLIWGGDIRSFHPPARVFGGVIGGSPCQDFSKARRSEPTGNGLAMLAEFVRVVLEASPDWFLLENVPQVPDIVVPGYSIQRFDLHASEVGVNQNRLRHFQYGSRFGLVLRLDRPARKSKDALPCLTTGDLRSWSNKCRLQGLPPDFDLPSLSQSGKSKALGNGVPLPMAEFIAAAVKCPVDPAVVRLCICGCGRSVDGKKRAALAACRKRIERRKVVTLPGELLGARSRVTNRQSQAPGRSHVTLRNVSAIDRSQ